ncbi:MAG: type 4a pilus biogenesis protein PilO [Coriobacteriia bacterium]|nr:type 4a pilus biogenesis protein PilO [Coriobacteriia bacterium]
MGRLSAAAKLVIAIAVIGVLAIAFIFLAILPMFQEASDLDLQIEDEKVKLTTAEALLARRQSAKAQSATNEVELMQIANRVPDSPQLPSVIIELQDVANYAGLEFVQIQVGDLVPGKEPEGGGEPQYSAVPVTVLLDGDWVDVTEYFHRLDTLDRGIRVTSSTFTYVPETEDVPAYVQANIVLEVYVMAAAESMPAATPEADAEEAPPADAAPSQ